MKENVVFTMQPNITTIINFFQFDFDFNIPSPRSPEYLSPSNSPTHFTDDIDFKK